MGNTKHIWEGWTVQDFIDELDWEFNRIMGNMSHNKPFTTREEVRQWCRDNQPYYKKHIPEVANHFIKKAGL